jgi:acylphosphatase
VIEPRSRLSATVRGGVQGVGYRVFVQGVAHALALDGWVANRSDGSVEVVAEGPAAALERLVDRLREGPPAATVRTVEVHMEPARGQLAGFAIRSGAHRGD